MGHTSEAYAVVRVWKIPHGIPQRTSATTSMGRDVAKTERKMNPVRATMAIIMTIFGP